VTEISDMKKIIVEKLDGREIDENSLEILDNSNSEFQEFLARAYLGVAFSSLDIDIFWSEYIENCIIDACLLKDHAFLSSFIKTIT
jgi:hypothetical protein